MKLFSRALAIAAASTSSCVFADANSYFGASYSSRQNDVITVIADTEVEYDDSAYVRYEFSQKLYKDFRLGATLQLDEQAKDVLGYSGYFTKGRWFASVETSEFSGVMVNDDGEAFAEFEDNRYLDIKLMKKFANPRDDIEKNISHGIQYLTYERPAAYRQDDIEYIDTSLQTHFISYVFEVDFVKQKLISGGIEKAFDWYFYTTTGLGVGMLDSSDPKLRNAPEVDGSPEQTTWTGFGIAGEYELGLVYFLDMPGLRLAAKAGYRADLEGPVMFHGGSFDDIDDAVHPDEQLLNHGPNVSLAVAF